MDPSLSSLAVSTQPQILQVSQAQMQQSQQRIHQQLLQAQAGQQQQQQQQQQTLMQQQHVLSSLPQQTSAAAQPVANQLNSMTSTAASTWSTTAATSGLTASVNVIPVATIASTANVPTVNAVPLSSNTMSSPATMSSTQTSNYSLPTPTVVSSVTPGQASMPNTSAIPAGTNAPSIPSVVSTALALQGSPSRPIRTTAAIGSDPTKVLDKQRLQELVKEVDPLEQLDDDVEEMLMQIADDFIDNVVSAASLLAKHRKASTVEVKDVQLHLERNWNMWIPGFGALEDAKPYKKAATTEAHKQRMALIKKTLKR